MGPAKGLLAADIVLAGIAENSLEIFGALEVGRVGKGERLGGRDALVGPGGLHGEIGDEGRRCDLCMDR